MCSFTLKITHKCKTLHFQKLDMLTKAEEFTLTEFFAGKKIGWLDGAISNVFNKGSFNCIINDFFQKKNLLVSLSNCECAL